jgi:hypothetical protein
MGGVPSFIEGPLDGVLLEVFDQGRQVLDQRPETAMIREGPFFTRQLRDDRLEVPKHRLHAQAAFSLHPCHTAM